MRLFVLCYLCRCSICLLFAYLLCVHKQHFQFYKTKTAESNIWMHWLWLIGFRLISIKYMLLMMHRVWKRENVLFLGFGQTITIEKHANLVVLLIICIRAEAHFRANWKRFNRFLLFLLLLIFSLFCQISLIFDIRKCCVCVHRCCLLLCTHFISCNDYFSHLYCTSIF